MKNPSFLFAVSIGLIACASSTSEEGASGFRRDRTVASLSTEEASRLCDWSIGTQGGAGK
jgi:hypothetical protein